MSKSVSDERLEELINPVVDEDGIGPIAVRLSEETVIFQELKLARGLMRGLGFDGSDNEHLCWTKETNIALDAYKAFREEE